MGTGSWLAVGKVFAQRFHFGQRVLVVGAVGGADAGVQVFESFVDAAQLGEGLRSHLVGGNVVWIAIDAGGKLGQCGFAVVLRQMLHGKAVTCEGVGWIDLEDFVEGGDLVHTAILVVRRQLEWKHERG
jgi:hypothetical protein